MSFPFSSSSPPLVNTARARWEEGEDTRGPCFLSTRIMVFGPRLCSLLPTSRARSRRTKEKKIAAIDSKDTCSLSHRLNPKKQEKEACDRDKRRVQSSLERKGTDGTKFVNEPTWRCHQNPFIGALGIINLLSLASHK